MLTVLAGLFLSQTTAPLALTKQELKLEIIPQMQKEKWIRLAGAWDSTLFGDAPLVGKWIYSPAEKNDEFTVRVDLKRTDKYSINLLAKSLPKTEDAKSDFVGFSSSKDFISCFAHFAVQKKSEKLPLVVMPKRNFPDAFPYEVQLNVLGTFGYIAAFGNHVLATTTTQGKFFLFEDGPRRGYCKYELKETSKDGNEFLYSYSIEQKTNVDVNMDEVEEVCLGTMRVNKETKRIINVRGRFPLAFDSNENFSRVIFQMITP